MPWPRVFGHSGRTIDKRWSRVKVARKNHSSHGGRKAYLNFELKDAPKARGLQPSQILDFKFQIRSGQPCDEWGGVAGAANCFGGLESEQVNVVIDSQHIEAVCRQRWPDEFGQRHKWSFCLSTARMAVEQERQ
jgi:hypothetical protein